VPSCLALVMSYAKDMSADTLSSNDVDHELVAALRVGVMRLARRLRLERSGSDLTLTHLSALGTLSRYGDLTIGELAAMENVKPPSMTRTINCLQEFGLVTRTAHQSDGRQVVVGLTDHARAVLDEDRRRRDAWLALQLADLEPGERELLRAVAPLLDRMASRT
jgi:DNA-binding MarR family transcriptional regulator